jgi:hypothetical protein
MAADGAPSPRKAAARAALRVGLLSLKRCDELRRRRPVGQVCMGVSGADVGVAPEVPYLDFLLPVGVGGGQESRGGGEKSVRFFGRAAALLEMAA